MTWHLHDSVCRCKEVVAAREYKLAQSVFPGVWDTYEARIHVLKPAYLTVNRTFHFQPASVTRITALLNLRHEAKIDMPVNECSHHRTFQYTHRPQRGN